MKNRKKKRVKPILELICLAAAVFFVLYGIMVRSLGSGTDFYLFWLLMGVCSALLCLSLQFDPFDRLPAWIRWSMRIMLAVMLAFFLIFEGRVVSHFRDQGQDHLDYILVLGAQVYESGPSPVLRFRLDRALLYLQENPDTVCIVSGGQGPNEPFAEAIGMADYLMKKGIEKERILIEDSSLTTKENMMFSRELFSQEASVGIVTNNFHLYRALQMADHAGIENACGIAAGSTKTYLLNNMVREFLGEIKFLITG